MIDSSATPPPAAPQGESYMEEAVSKLVEQVSAAKAEITPPPRPQIRIDPAMVAETLQRKNAQLMSQLVYDNSVLETALETAHREIGDLQAKNSALREALGS